MNKKFLIILAVIIGLVGLLAWLFIESTKPLPGTKITDLGRGHVPIGTKVDYNSNPPTSGKHYEDWVKSGVYSEPKDDRNLVHSLEHGYVVMSYNCDVKPQSLNLVKSVYAHGIEDQGATPSSSEATASASLSDSFRSDDCHKLVDQLITIYEKKGKTRLIVIPRPNLDDRIALTAWGYLDKFNPSAAGSGLSARDMEKIEKFIDAHLNQGPEKTMESE